MAESLLHQHRRPFLLANLYSLGHWLGVFTEFWLMAAFLGYPLSLVPIARSGDYRTPCVSHPLAGGSRCPRIRPALGDRRSWPGKCPRPQPLPAHSIA